MKRIDLTNISKLNLLTENELKVELKHYKAYNELLDTIDRTKSENPELKKLLNERLTILLEANMKLTQAFIDATKNLIESYPNDIKIKSTNDDNKPS